MATIATIPPPISETGKAWAEYEAWNASVDAEFLDGTWPEERRRTKDAREIWRTMSEPHRRPCRASP
jgi:hypothetical protein